MSAIRYAIKRAAELRHEQEAADKAVAKRIESGGRKPSYAPSLKNDMGKCVAGFLPPRGDEVPLSVAVDWQLWDCTYADAGVLPLSTYVELYGAAERPVASRQA